MKSNASYLGDGLDYETRQKKPLASNAAIEAMAFGGLQYLAAGVAADNDEWCRAEIMRLIQLGKDIEQKTETEAAA